MSTVDNTSGHDSFIPMSLQSSRGKHSSRAGRPCELTGDISGDADF